LCSVKIKAQGTTLPLPLCRLGVVLHWLPKIEAAS